MTSDRGIPRERAVREPPLRRVPFASRKGVSGQRGDFARGFVSADTVPRFSQFVLT